MKAGSGKKSAVKTWLAHIWNKSPLKNSECGRDILGRDARYGKATRGRRNLEGSTYEVMNHADLLLVTSGTATLESACFGTPLLVLYRMSRLSWWIARRLVNIPDIGLVNVVAGRRIAPEFLQDEVDPNVLSPVVRDLLSEPEKRRVMTRELRQVRDRLGTPGASSRVAELALEMVAGKGDDR